jgi:hypothetical protein
MLNCLGREMGIVAVNNQNSVLALRCLGMAIEVVFEVSLTQLIIHYHQDQFSPWYEDLVRSWRL